MYSACKLNEQGDNIQPWLTPFPIWNQSVVPCPVLTVASWPAYRFLKRQVRWSGIPISLKNFPYFVVTHTINVSTVSEAEVDVFLEFSCFFYDSANVSNLISGSSAFYKSSLNNGKFSVHMLLKPGSETSEHYFASVWGEYNCVVVWAFFGIALLWDWIENRPFKLKDNRFTILCWFLPCIGGLLYTYGCGSFLKSLLDLLEYLLLFYALLVLVLRACGILVPRAGIGHAPPALEGEVTTTGPLGKSWKNSSSEMQNELWSCTSPWLKDKQTNLRSFVSACVLSCFTRVPLFGTPRTVAHQAPLSVGFSRQQYWSGLPCPSPGHLLHPEIEPLPDCTSCTANGFFIPWATWDAMIIIFRCLNHPCTKKDGGLYRHWNGWLC